MSILDDFMTGGVSSIVKGVTDLASDLITTDKERLAAEVELENIQLKREQADHTNVDSARKHDAAVQESESASFLSKNVAYWLDLFIVAATFGMAYLILFQAIPPENKEIFYTTFGSLLTLCMTVVNFHRGSSMRSQSKDATIAALSAK